eukprot:9740206-Alexandrium_andersonii.AAC.1
MSPTCRACKDITRWPFDVFLVLLSRVRIRMHARERTSTQARQHASTQAFAIRRSGVTPAEVSRALVNSTRRTGTLGKRTR